LYFFAAADGGVVVCSVTAHTFHNLNSFFSLLFIRGLLLLVVVVAVAIA